MAVERNAELEMHARRSAENGLALKPYSYRLIRGARSNGLVRVINSLARLLRDCIFIDLASSAIRQHRKYSAGCGRRWEKKEF